MNYTNWSPKELAQQLTALGFGQYSRDFRVNDIKVDLDQNAFLPISKTPSGTVNSL